MTARPWCCCTVSPTPVCAGRTRYAAGVTTTASSRPTLAGTASPPRFDPATSGSNRSEDMVADVVSILEALTRGGGELPLLVGHSMGAGIAGIVLAARPDLVCAGVLEDPPWFTWPPGDDRPPEEDTTQQWVQSFRDDLDAAVARGRIEQPLWPEIELRPWAVAKTQLDPSLTDPEQIVRQAPWIDDAAAITRPTLVVTGGRDDAVLVGPSPDNDWPSSATSTSRLRSSRGRGIPCAGTAPMPTTRSWTPGSELSSPPQVSPPRAADRRSSGAPEVTASCVVRGAASS